MRTLFFWLLLVFAGTYCWGWAQHVQIGAMSQREYNAYYLDETRKLYDKASWQASKWVDKLFKPVQRREAVLE